MNLKVLTLILILVIVYNSKTGTCIDTLQINASRPDLLPKTPERTRITFLQHFIAEHCPKNTPRVASLIECDPNDWTNDWKSDDWAGCQVQV